MKKVVLCLVAFAVVASLLLTSCSGSTTTSQSAETSTTVKTTLAAPFTTPVTTQSSTTTESGKWWSKFGTPQYGGSINVYAQSLDTVGFDPISFFGGMYSGYWRETLFYYDWTLDRNIWSFPGGFSPPEYLKGLLAEKWEWTGPTTVQVKIREGVKWQNKPPVNGRELTAQDIQYNYDRTLGTGSGFTEPSPMAGMLSNIERVVAVDKYTVEFRLKNSGATSIFQIVTNGMGATSFVPPEWVEQGDLTNWQYAVGTGPWILSELVIGNSMTLVRNGDYWGYDERYPENKLPYLDSIKIVAIPDTSTAIASLRSGRIDLTVTAGAFTWQQAEALLKTNPEIGQRLLPDPSTSIGFRVDKKPFDDIRVRKAMQMAIDRKAIAKTIYGGYVDGKPAGMMTPLLTDWTVPYDEWPEDLKAEYSYNPEKAKQLLKEAGYPDGFKTHVLMPPTISSELMQVVKAYFQEVGIDMEIRVMEQSAFQAYLAEGKHEQLTGDRFSGMIDTPTGCLQRRISSSAENYTRNNDPVFDELYNRLISATTMEEAKNISKEADLYTLRQHWSVNICPACTPIFWRNTIKGYSGEFMFFPNTAGATWARLWLAK